MRAARLQEKAKRDPRCAFVTVGQRMFFAKQTRRTAALVDEIRAEILPAQPVAGACMAESARSRLLTRLKVSALSEVTSAATDR